MSKMRLQDKQSRERVHSEAEYRGRMCCAASLLYGLIGTSVMAMVTSGCE
jgi:hypothetical protein